MIMAKLCKATSNVNDRIPTLKDLDKMGIPRKSTMLGFVVLLPKEDEFLAGDISNDGADLTAWCKSPGDAIRFPNAQAAHLFVKSYHKRESRVCALFENKSQYMVWGMPEENFA